MLAFVVRRLIQALLVMLTVALIAFLSFPPFWLTES